MSSKLPPKEVQELAYKWRKGTITPEEKAKLEDWYNQEPTDEILWSRHDDEETLKNSLLEKINIEVDGEETKVVPFPTSTIRYVKYAAAAMIVTAVTLWYTVDFNSQTQVDHTIAQTNIDRLPGRDAATLTLGDGSVVQLEEVGDGTISTQGNVVVSKKGGQVSYLTPADDNGGEVHINTISTARGNQYKLELSDGTMVWMNSASSMRFPAHFADDLREVELTGEAYFEVAKDAKRPFVVKSGDAVVEVLGTHFNINAYEDEGYIRTTLLEGAVKVRNKDSFVIIKPGEQAVQKQQQRDIQKSQVDVEQVMAWQQGFFEFNNSSLQEIMRQISRWYDVDVRFEGASKGKKYGGRISRHTNLKDILNLLRASGADFAMEDGVLVVRS
ncbi:FecR family protein [Chryseolinea soli]|uniref:DUF4974 domain-containing protein n=1 Tax=Chryseolinea soli TaxID=2321403 RepID=A0A385SM99_9BACT|nr:FecR family protein [Chryseolinea soli]AYB31962.1 DUF4974 domain-containing protein [Chryseolinea soli]